MNHREISFDNTEIAFGSLSDSELKQSYRLFQLMSRGALVNFGSRLATSMLKLPFLPGKSIIKKTIYKQFCGGETIRESLPLIEKLTQYNVKTILDYGVEAKDEEEELEKTAQHLVKGIEFAKKHPDVNIISSKITGLIRFALLEKVSAGETLNKKELAEWERGKKRVKFVSKAGYECDIQIYFDAEESWIQPAIDEIVTDMMRTYNKDAAIIFNTIQLYRHDKLAYFKECYDAAKGEGYHLGVKLVRGAYLEKENLRAETMGYATPMQPSKAASDRDFDLSLQFSMENLEGLAICVATHNENSCRLITELTKAKNINPSDTRIFFGQLFGMSDHLSFNLAQAGYNVAKYLPYGPVREVVPYLVRRAKENTSVSGQMTRELSFIKKEMKRRALL